MKCLIRAALLMACSISFAAANAQITPAPPPAAHPATAKQFAQWKSEIRQALFIPQHLPALEPHTWSTFIPAPGVLAERVTYTTLYGMRVPAIV